MKNTSSINNKNSTIMKSVKRIIFLLALSCIGISVFSQLVERTALAVKGQYDITMIGAPVLQPVWVKTQNPLEIDRPLTDTEMASCGQRLGINNDLSRESTASTNSVRLTAAMDTDAQAEVPASAIGVAMVYADCDDDNTTFQSSAAYLDFGADMACTTVKAAYLYWMGIREDGVTTTYDVPYPGTPTMKSYTGADGVGTSTGADQILFKAAGDASYTTITADTVLKNTNAELYVYMKDVTTLVQGKPGGLYWCANIKNPGTRPNSSPIGVGARGGWNLVVVFEPPNCPPRVIKFWDGYDGAAGGKAFTFNFEAGDVPATANSVSYLGFATEDAEDDAGILAQENSNPTTLANSSVKFKSNTGDTVYINPFFTDQPAVSAYKENGTLVNNIRLGMPSSTITSYSKWNGLNGNSITRLPNQVNAVGFGLHHLKLPVGAMGAAADFASITMPSERNGAYGIFLAYMAIETMQPRLVMSKTASVSTAEVEDVFTYTIGVSNIGNYETEPGAYVDDTLDLPIDYVPGSLVMKDKNGTVITPPTATVHAYDDDIASKDVNERLRIYLPVLAAANAEGVAQDSVVITFDVQIKPISRTDIWNIGCHRTIRNRSTVYYESLDGATFQTESNASEGCPGEGLFVEVVVDIDDADLLASFISTYFETFDISLTPTANVMTRFRADLVDKGLASGVADLYTITDQGGNEITAGRTFDAAIPVETFYGTYDIGYGCVETYTFIYSTEEFPIIVDVTHTDPLCAAGSDGTLTIDVDQGGVDGINCYVYNALDMGTAVYIGFTPSGETTFTHNVPNLPAGVYVVQLVDFDEGIVVDSETETINSTQGLTLTVGGSGYICNGDAATLTATAGGGSSPYNYVWKSSADGVTWSAAIGGATNSTYTPSPATTTYYKAYVCSGDCQLTDTIKVVVGASTTSTTWQGDVDSDWTDPDNWSSGVPDICTNVIIPNVNDIAVDYPVIGSTGICNNITFEPGAAVKGLENLTYRKAFVQLESARDHWYTLTTPLKEMYSGDYYFNGAPEAYMKLFNTTSPDDLAPNTLYTGTFTRSFSSLEVPLTPGLGFAFNMSQKTWDYPNGSSNQPADTTITFPRTNPDNSLVTSYVPYNSRNGYPYTVLAKTVTKDANKAYRLAAENASNVMVDQTVTLTDGVNLIGNPMMTHINIDPFLDANALSTITVYDATTPFATSKTFNASATSEMTFTLVGAAIESRQTCGGVNMLSPNLSESNTQYMECEVTGGDTITSVLLHISRILASVSASNAVLVWCEHADFDRTDVHSYELISMNARDLSCDQLAVTAPAGIKSFRVYRRVKYTSGTKNFIVTGGPEVGDGNSTIIGSIQVTTGGGGARISNHVKLWTGTNYATYDGETDTWDGGYAGDYIAPMQSFIVTSDGGGNLAFDIDNAYFASTVDVTSTLRSATTKKKANMLFIKAQKDGKVTGTVITNQDNASNEYGKDDIFKLFTPLTQVSDIYSMASGYALAFNKFNQYPFTAPLGIKTSAYGKVKLSFEGAESFADADVYLINSSTGQRINLKENTAYEVELTPENEQGTLFVEFRKAVVSDNREINSSTDVQIFTKEKNTVRVISSPNNPINEITIMDEVGRILVNRTKLNGNLFDTTLNSGTKVVLVRAVTAQGVKISKLLVK